MNVEKQIDGRECFQLLEVSWSMKLNVTLPVKGGGEGQL